MTLATLERIGSISEQQLRVRSRFARSIGAQQRRFKRPDDGLITAYQGLPIRVKADQ